MVLCSYWYYPPTVRLPSKMSNGCQFFYACSEKPLCWLVLMKGAFEECITYTQMVDKVFCVVSELMFLMGKKNPESMYILCKFSIVTVFFKINCLASIFNRKNL